MAREIVDTTAKLTWITAGYGWISIVAPIVTASPAIFSAAGSPSANSWSCVGGSESG